MKKIFLAIFCIIVIGGFVVPNMAEAAYTNTYNLPYVFSPNSNQSSTPLDDASISSSGSSVFIGAAQASGFDSINYLESNTNQPIGIYGLGASLASLGTANLFNIRFDTHLRTYDISTSDIFEAVITKGSYIWDGGTFIGGWTWGGTTQTGKETSDLTPAVLRSTVYASSPGTDYYINFVLQTTGNTNYPSWGRFSDTGIEAKLVPEPASMALLGLGLAGLLRFRKKRI